MSKITNFKKELEITISSKLKKVAVWKQGEDTRKLDSKLLKLEEIIHHNVIWLKN